MATPRRPAPKRLECYYCHATRELRRAPSQRFSHLWACAKVVPCITRSRERCPVKPRQTLRKRNVRPLVP